MHVDPTSITSTEIAGFRRDGVVRLPGLLDSTWLELLAAGVEYNRTHPSRWSHWYTRADQAVGFWSDYVTWPDVEEYRRVVFDSGLADIAAQLMESHEVRFFHEHVLVKEPGATERTPWHHDTPYYCLDGLQNVSMWIALDPVPRANGLRFVAGSHHWDRLFVPRRFLDHESYAPADDRFETVPDIDGELRSDADRYRVLSYDIEPGDVLAFHFRTLHDAPGNSLVRRRRAVSLRWIGDDATFATRPWEVSPPYEPDGLDVGSGLGSDPRFPIVPIRTS